MDTPVEIFPMQPSKLFTVLALGTSSFSHVICASSQKQGGNSEGSSQSSQTQKTGSRNEDKSTLSMPKVTIADSDRYASETSRERCIRESASTILDNQDPIKWMEITEEHRQGSFPSKSYLRLHDKHPDTIFMPLKIRKDEIEDQTKPRNFMARIMKRYRDDMGLTPVLDFDAPNAPDSEVRQFLECFENVPADVSQNGRTFAEIFEAYSFFRYLGIIPLNPQFPEQCESIKTTVGLTTFDDIRRVYNKKMNEFTIIDWDLLDLMRFKYQKFPMVGPMIRDFTYEYQSFANPEEFRYYTTPLSLTPYGRNSLEKYADRIRFINPNTRKGSIKLLFQRLYRRYFDAMKKDANPYYIDWSHCVVANWPESISRHDATTWKSADIKLLNNLIDRNELKFSRSPRVIVDAPPPLGKPSKFDEKSFVDFAGAPGSKDSSVSDDENICGDDSIIRKGAKLMEKFRASEERRIARKEAKDEMKAKTQSNEISVAEANFDVPLKAASKKKRSSYSDEEAEFDFEHFEEKSRLAKREAAAKIKEKAKPQQSSQPKVTESEGSVKIINVKDVSSQLADPRERQKLLAKLLEMFRNQTGLKQATEIDWNLLRIHYYQNHLLPFSIGFETEGDIRTVKNLIASKSFKFLNLSKISDRRSRAYERLYAIYAAAVGKYRNEYDIEWDDVIFTGLPAKLGEDFEGWSAKKLEALEHSLDENLISCEMTDDLKEAIEEAEAEVRAREEKEAAAAGKHFGLPDSPDSVGGVTIEDGSIISSSTSETEMLQPDIEPILCAERQDKVNRLPIGKRLVIPLTPSEGFGKTPSFKAMLGPTDVTESKKRAHSALNQQEGNQVTKLVKDVETEGTLSDWTGNNRIVAYGEFIGSTVGEVLAHQASIEESIANYTEAMAAFPEHSRQRRIISNIIDCLQVILGNVTRFESHERSRMSTLEAHEYLDTFLDSLMIIGQSGDFSVHLDLQKLLTATVRFRAHLAGAKITRSRGKMSVKIPESIIVNLELFGFLTKGTYSWDWNLLDFFIDDRENPIFIN